MRDFAIKTSLLLKANVKVRYRQTWVGFFWVLLNPILIFCVQWVIFRQVFNHNDPSYALYLLSGLFPWFFLSQTVEMSCTQLKSHSLFARNLRIGPAHLIASLVLENYLNFLCYTILTFFVLSFVSEVATSYFLFFLIASVPFAAFVGLVSFCAAILHTLFKDVKYIAHFLFTLLYFLTPTFYKLDFLSEIVQGLVWFNPMFWQLRLFRLNLEAPSEVLSILSVNLGLLLTGMIIAFLVWKKLRAKVYLKL